jgi:hypothetical protein
MDPFNELWQHVKSRSATVAAPPTKSSPNKGGPSKAAPEDKPADKTPKSDSSGLRATDPVTLSSDGGKTGDGTPKSGINYDLYVHVFNAGKLPSGPFIVRFENHGDESWEGEFEHKGLDSGAKVKALVNFGELQAGEYRMAACIYAKSAPDDPIDCAGEFGFSIK